MARPARLRPAFSGRLACVVSVALVCGSCSTTSPHYDPQKPHHTEKGFKNNYLTGEIGGSFLKWQYDRIVQGLPKPPANDYRFPVDTPDVAWLKVNRTVNSATWIGHATVLVQAGGINILTDPIFSERASPVSFAGPKRKVRPGLDYAQLPHVDVVVISHNHYDHLDRDSVLRLNQQAGGPPLFLVPLGVKAWMNDIGITSVRELDWWENVDASGVLITFVPVQHWSARSVNDRFKTLWGGWVMQTNMKKDAMADMKSGAERSTVPAPVASTQSPAAASSQVPYSIFFAGDTGYSKDFADIYQRFDRFDLALLPIGAYAPRWFMKNQHVDPEEAVKIHRDLRATQSLAIHWGTFELTDEPLDAPPLALAQELKRAGVPAADFAVLRHGETRKLGNAAAVSAALTPAATSAATTTGAAMPVTASPR